MQHSHPDPTLSQASSALRPPWARRAHCGVTAGAALLVLAGVADAPRRAALALSTDRVLSVDSEILLLVLRLLLAAGGILVLALAALWHLGRRHPWHRALTSDFAAFCAHGPGLPSTVSRRLCVGLPLVAGAVTLGQLATIWLSFTYFGTGTAWFDWMAMEDGVWESLTAAAFLGAGIVLGASLGRNWPAWPRWGERVPALVLACVLVVAAGEEVSWGQRWLGFATPDFLAERNVQRETNLHNLGGYWFQHVSFLGVLSVGVLLPLAARLVGVVAYVVDRLRLPVPSLSLLPFAVAAVVFEDHGVMLRLWGNPPWRLSEARETVFAVVILCAAIQLAARARQAARASSQAQAGLPGPPGPLVPHPG
ncbi:MAG: hypothetical protein AB1505_33165 [Candidatus Latescibacterota bacterium]